jgi:hypothetical protein
MDQPLARELQVIQNNGIQVGKAICWSWKTAQTYGAEASWTYEHTLFEKLTPD